MFLFLQCCPSPIGDLVLVHDADGHLLALDFAEREAGVRARLERHFPNATVRHGDRGECTRAALAAYFSGQLSALHDVPIRLLGTVFQRQVWTVLREIPAGQTWSYSDVARRVGSPAAVRAVGLTNASNPIMLAVPCHRVVGRSGKLTGYAGGLRRKAQLLAHERGQQLADGAYSSSSSS